MTQTAKKPETVQERATYAREWFVLKGPRVGGKDKFWARVDGAPEWIGDMSRDAHNKGNMWPDDWRYQFIMDSLDRLAEWDDMDNADAWEPPDWNHKRTEWLDSHGKRSGYVDEAINEYGRSTIGGIMDTIAWGMIREFEEVEASVRHYLETLDSEEYPEPKKS